MLEILKKQSLKAGMPPGSLVYINEKIPEKVNVTIFEYDHNSVLEKTYTCETGLELSSLDLKNNKNYWINIDGLHKTELIENLGSKFNIHPLVLEDIVNTGQRPKLDYYDDYYFLVCKMIYQDEKTKRINAEQVSMILGSNYVVSFQERAGDTFNNIRERLRHNKGIVRTKGADYLTYTLIDSIVDNYFILLEYLNETTEDLEDEAILTPSNDTRQEIQSLKREIIFLKKSVWPLREVVKQLEKSDSTLIKKDTKLYLRDVYDHTVHVIENIEMTRDLITGLLDIYLSSMSNKMNEIMKVLTIISTIFIPLTFLSGLYGMNFKFMPELNYKYGYQITLFIMFLIFSGMLIYFKRRKWL